MSHEKIGQSDEWYTPKYIFDAMDAKFCLDVAHPKCNTNVPAKAIITEDSLSKIWNGFVWMNAPFGNSKTKMEWIDKFIKHGNGIALYPDRTSSSWWQKLAKRSDAVLFVGQRIKFIKPDGTIGESPANGTTLFAIGFTAKLALIKAQENGLGILYFNNL